MKPNRNDTERQQTRAEDALCEALSSLETIDECRNFLKDLCTPAELQALPFMVLDFISSMFTPPFRNGFRFIDGPMNSVR